MTIKLELIKERYEKIIKGEITKRLHYFDELNELKQQITEEINEGNNRITSWALMIKNFFKISDRYELITKEIFKDFEAIILEFYTELSKASSDSELVESYGDEIGSLTSDIENLNEENAKLLEMIKEKEEEIEGLKQNLENTKHMEKKISIDDIKVLEKSVFEPQIKTPIEERPTVTCQKCGKTWIPQSRNPLYCKFCKKLIVSSRKEYIPPKKEEEEIKKQKEDDKNAMEKNV